MTVAESLKRFRKMFNLKQKDIAAVLEVTPQAYQVYESKVTPSVNLIITLANHYKVSADYLLGLSDNPRPAQIDDNEIREALALRNALKGVLQEHNI